MSQPCFSTSELLKARSNELSEKRLAHLDTCPLCSAALQGLELSNELEGLGSEMLLALVPDFKVEPPKKTPSLTIIKSIKWLAAAAAAFLFYWIGIDYKMNPPQSTVMGAFDFVEQPYQRILRGSANNSDIYSEAAKAFSEGDFQNSISLYIAQLDSIQSPLLETRGNYELGIAYWKNGDFQDAVDRLTRARMGELDYYEDATWALAMLYRQIGELENARELFKDLAFEKQGPYAERAMQALELLKL